MADERRGGRVPLAGGGLALAAAIALVCTVLGTSWQHTRDPITPAHAPGAAPSAPGAAPSALPATTAAPPSEPSDVPSTMPDPAWVDRVSATTGIPGRALRAYATAELEIRRSAPDCAIGWNTIAAIGDIESGHGTHDGAKLALDGSASPAIRGPALDGDGVAAIPDTDEGSLDGDGRWDRAMGPMQFIPDTWSHWGADSDGDGFANPDDIDDAADAAARYLCASGDADSTAAWRTAVRSYNDLERYVDDVASLASWYATRAGGG